MIPTSTSADSPARLIWSSTSPFARSNVSSIRAGWIRPSDTSFSSVRRATSRRTGSKHDSTTASGVSSMMRLTPVTASNVLMLRPSRPMIRPFMSSDGRGNTETVDSDVCSEATRWIAIVTILRARFSPSSRAACSISRTVAMASRLASPTISLARLSFASWTVMRLTRSSSRRCASPACSSCAFSVVRLWPIRCSSLSRSAIWLSRSSSAWSRRATRASFRWISSRRTRRSSSAARRMAEISSFTSRRDVLVFVSASTSASESSLAARTSAPRVRLETISRRTT